MVWYNFTTLLWFCRAFQNSKTQAIKLFNVFLSFSKNFINYMFSVLPPVPPSLPIPFHVFFLIVPLFPRQLHNTFISYTHKCFVQIPIKSRNHKWEKTYIVSLYGTALVCLIWLFLVAFIFLWPIYFVLYGWEALQCIFLAQTLLFLKKDK